MQVATQLQGSRRGLRSLLGLRGPNDAFRPPPGALAPFTATQPRPAAAWAPWASTPYGGLCVQPATGAVQDNMGNIVGGSYGGLAPPAGLPACPTQTATPMPTSPDGVVNSPQSGGAGAETPFTTVYATPPTKKWVPWAIGGVLAAAGAAAYALMHR